MRNKIFGILLSIVLTLTLVAIPTSVAASTVVLTGVTVDAEVYDDVLVLENKDAAWSVIPSDGIGALLYYNKSGASSFTFKLVAEGLNPGTNYSLVYYADTENRFVDWGGGPSSIVIASGMSVDGTLVLSGNPNLGADLPCPPDANAYFYDYTLPPDNYAHATGAKIWLVPTSDLTAGNMPLSVWHPTQYLFETDLIEYDDTNIESEVVSFTIDRSNIDFGPLVPGQTGNGGNIVIENTGNVYIDVGADVAGDDVFLNILFNGNPYIGYLGDNIAPAGTDTVVVTLPVPGDFVARGPQTGTLTFWAEASY